MSKLVEYFLKRTFLVNLITVFVCGVGLIILLGLKRDLAPPMSFKGMSVNLQLPGSSALQMESFVVRPIENSLRSLPGLKEMRSESGPGWGSINFQFNDRVSHDHVAAQLKEAELRISALLKDLPRDLREPRLNQWKREGSWFMTLALINGDAVDLEHRQLMVKFKNELAKIPGIIAVNDDMRSREVFVHLDPKKLESYGITTDQVASQLRAQLEPIAVTNIKLPSEDITISLPDPKSTLQGLENLIIRTSDFGWNLRLKDLGTIENYFPRDSSFNLVDGQNYIEFWLRKDLERDIIELDQEVQAKVKELSKDLPKGLDIRILERGANMVQQQIDVIQMDAVTGSILVLLFLGYFLGWRVALMTAAGVPFSYFGSAMVLKALGISINLISVVAMILVLGILVDDAIVISQMYSRYLRLGFSRREAAYKASIEMLGPVSAGIATTMIAFLPIVLLGGWLTEVFISIPVVVISSLAVSWIEAFFILPNHLEHFVKDSKETPRVMSRIEDLYQRALGFLLHYRKTCAAAFLALLVATGYLWHKEIKTDFNLSIGPREVSIYAVLKDNPSREEMQEKLKPITNYLQKYVDGSDVKNLFLSIGEIWVDGKNHRGNRYARLGLSINNDLANPDKIEARLLKDIKKQLPKLKTKEWERLSAEGQFADSEAAKADENLFNLYFQGSDSLSLRDVHQQAQARLKDLKGFVDVTYNPDDLAKTWRFESDPVKLQRYGISEVDLSQQLRQLLGRHEIGKLYYQGENLSVGIGFDDQERFQKVDQLHELSILGPQKVLVPLRYLGSWKEENIQGVWHRLQGERTLDFKVKYDPDKIQHEEFKKILEAKAKILEKDFPTYQVRTEDADQQRQENKQWMIEALLICVLGIFFVIALQLQSITQPILICSAILFGFVGTVWAVYTHGYKFDIMVMIGLLGVAGVSVNASIIMVDWINKNSGTSSLDAITKGCRDRLEPIFLTTVTTLAGLFPMAYGIGGDAGFTSFLAFSMAWGILSSTVLSLFVLPVLLLLREDLLRGLSKSGSQGARFMKRLKWNQKAPEAPSAESPIEA